MRASFLTHEDAERVLASGGLILTRIDEAKRDGRTGGGPPCPNKECGARALYRLDNDMRLQCRNCGMGAVVLVTPEGIKVEEAVLPPPCGGVMR